jgi:hypothetical protein
MGPSFILPTIQVTMGETRVNASIFEIVDMSIG